MKKLIFCYVLLLLPGAQLSCNVTIDSIINEETASTGVAQLVGWPWSITIDNIDGDDDEKCLTDQTVRCKTLRFVLNNAAKYSQSTCLKLILSGNMSDSSSHVIPYNAPTLSGISLYFISEGDGVITCEKSTGNATRLRPTAWSIQDTDFVVFKSLQFINCNQRLEIANTTNVYFENVGISNFSNSGLRLSNNFNVTLKNLSLVNCSNELASNFRFPENSALSLVYRNSGHATSYMQIFNSQFHYNSINTGKIEGTSMAVIGKDFPGRGGALGIFINEAIKNTAVIMTIDKCNFTNNKAEAYGGALYLQSNQLSSGHSFILTNSIFESNYAAIGGAGIAQGSIKIGDFDSNTIFTPSHYYLVDCKFTNNTAQFGGAVSFIEALDRKQTNDIISIHNCIFDGNIGMNIGAAILFSSLTLPHLAGQDIPYNISNCVFTSNASPNGILGIMFKDVEFHGTNHFISNRGSSIRAADSNIAIHGDVNFSHNTVEFFYGTIRVQDFVQFQLYSGSQMIFHNNSGVITSAFLILLHQYPRVFSHLENNPWCFLLHEDVKKPPSEWTDVNITFDSNMAFLAPNIYMSNFELCSWQSTTSLQVNFSIDEVLKWPIFNFHNLTRIDMSTHGDIGQSSDSFNKGISTAPVKIIVKKKNYSARPGELLTLDILPVDVFDNPSAIIFGFTQLTEDGGVPSGRLAQYIDLSANYKKDVILEPNIKEFLPGQRSVELTYGLSPDKTSLKNFTIAIFQAVKLDVSDVPVVFINVTIDECLPGYILRKANQNSTSLTCECDFEGASQLIISCETNGSVILQDSWFAFSRPSQIFSTLKIVPCPPYFYCQCRKERVNSSLCSAAYNHSNEDQQCHPDREGILCGRCRHSHQGVGVLTMLCQDCENDSITFLPIVLLVLSDIILVILILSSATPFPPSLKGILFYIQVMSYSAATFPLSTWRGNKYMLYISSALSLYFPWDFCLYDGMTALASHFFNYIPFIVAIIIVSIVLKYRPHGYTSPKGKKFQKIYSKFRSKCAHGIWTLVLLMFTRVSYNPWVITDCIDITNDGLKWYWDGSVHCFNDYQHILLFLFGMMVLLFSSGFFIFIGLLTIGALGILTNKYATYRHLRESAIYGYKHKYRWWPVVDIGRRFMLAFHLTKSPSFSVLQIFIFFVIFLVHIYAQPYKKAWHNWLEAFLLAYIIILLSMRSTNFIIRSLLPNAYAGFMLPNDNAHDRISTPLKNPLPPSDALTHFFVPLLYIPLAIGLVIVGKCMILWLYRCVFYCFCKSKIFLNARVNDESSLDGDSGVRIYDHNNDSDVLVTLGDGRVSRVAVTYAEY